MKALPLWIQYLDTQQNLEDDMNAAKTEDAVEEEAEQKMDSEEEYDNKHRVGYIKIPCDRQDRPLPPDSQPSPQFC